MLAELLKAEDAKLREAETDIERCLDDFKYFCTHYVYTRYTDPVTEKRSYELYPDFPYLDDYTVACNLSGLLVVPKSRGMIATTHPLIMSLHECVKVWKRGGVDRTALLRQNAKHAEELVARVRESWKRLPLSLRPPLTRDNLDHLIFEGGGEIRSLPEMGETGRGEDWDRVLLDEGAYQDHLDDNIGAFGPRTRTIIVPSTYNGDGNTFTRLVDADGYPLRRIMSMPHDLHPGRIEGTPEGDAYLDLMRAKMSESDFLIEIKMRRDVYKTSGYYGSDYSPDVVQEFEWDGQGVITIGMDYSYKHPAAVVAFENEINQWCRIREYLCADMTLENFVPMVFRDCLGRYDGATFRVAPDPFRGRQTKGDSTAAGNPATDLNTIRELADRILGEDTLVSVATTGKLLRKEGHRRVRRPFKRRPDQTFGTLIHPRCQRLVQGFSGAYGPRENASPHALELEEPDERRVHVHVMDADRYGFCEFVHQDLGLEYVDEDRGADYARAQRALARAQAHRAARGV